jgi:hypothetical protein
MKDDELKKLGSVGVVLGPGAKGNNFIGMNMSGFETAVVTLTDGDKGPEDNNFIGGEFKRFQPEIPVKEQVEPPSAETTAPAEQPWYKDMSVQIAGAVIAAVIIGALGWLGFPVKG